MEEGLRKLYTGDFNQMMQEEEPDGSIIITLTDDNDTKSYRFRVRNLYEEDEEVMSHKVVEHVPPAFLVARLEEARRKPHGRHTDT